LFAVLLLALAENPIQLVPDGTLLFHVILIVIMVSILNRTLYRPINNILAERENRTRGRLKDAREMMKIVETRLAQYEQSLRAARTEGYRLLEQERASILKEREAKINALRVEIGDWTTQQKEEIARQAQVARQSLAAESSRMAIEISSRVLRRPIKDAAEQNLSRV
jgi:F-type H+-transporting ATPase subunit b